MTRVHAALALALVACPASEVCEEDPRAQVLDRIALTIGPASGEQVIEAELAASATERERGWKHRRCDLDALVLLADSPGSELPVWGCALTQPIDVWFVAAGVVVESGQLEPCAEPCGGCPRLGEGLEVDALLEAPRGELELALGDGVRW